MLYLITWQVSHACDAASCVYKTNLKHNVQLEEVLFSAYVKEHVSQFLAMGWLQFDSVDDIYICNKAFAAKQRLQHTFSTLPKVSLAEADSVTTLCLQGLPSESLGKAKQAWQKLIVERNQYIQ